MGIGPSTKSSASKIIIRLTVSNSIAVSVGNPPKLQKILKHPARNSLVDGKSGVEMARKIVDHCSAQVKLLLAIGNAAFSHEGMKTKTSQVNLWLRAPDNPDSTNFLQPSNAT